MKAFLWFVLMLTVFSAALGSPLLNFPILRQSENTETSIFGNGYSKLVEELILNLQKAADQAKDSVATFSHGLHEEAKKSQEKFQQNLNNLRDKITKAIENMSGRFSSSGDGVKECIKSYSDEASLLFNQTAVKTGECRDQRFKEAEEMIKGLTSLSEQAQNFATSAYAELRECTATGTNFWAMGSCLGALTMKTEYKGAVFLTQNGLSVARVSLYMATLPAALEVCAGSSLVEAGVGTAKILMDIGGCSASSIYQNLVNSSPKF